MILSLLLPLLGSQSMTQLQHSNCVPSTNKTASPSYIEVSAPVCRMVPSRAVYLPIMPFPGTVIAGVLCLFAHTLHWVQKWHETNADLHCLHQHVVHFQCPHSPGLQSMIHMLMPPHKTVVGCYEHSGVLDVRHQLCDLACLATTQPTYYVKLI